MDFLASSSKREAGAIDRTPKAPAFEEAIRRRRETMRKGRVPSSEDGHASDDDDDADGDGAG